MNAETSYFTARDGTQIFVRSWSPLTTERAVIHLVHGLAEHSARYERIAQTFAARGFHVYAHDQRGHGFSVSGEDALGHAGDHDGWNQMVDDLSDLISLEKINHPDVPLILLGHSMGSLIVRQFLSAGSHQINAVILSGTNGNVSPLIRVGALIARLERLRLGRRGKSQIINSLSFDSFNKQFSPARTPFDWLTRDAAEVDRYIADPRCGFICSTQFWIDFLAGINSLSGTDQLRQWSHDLPVLLITGERDPVTENAAGTLKLADDLKNAGLKKVTLKIYPQARHELFNELNRDEVIEDLMNWIEPLVPSSVTVTQG